MSRRLRGAGGEREAWGLRDVLALPVGRSGDSGFMNALMEQVHAPPGARARVIGAFGRLPEVVRMIILLNAFWMIGDVTQFLEESIGGALHEVQRWCRRIGARRTAAYLRQTAALFPRGRVPVDGAKRRARMREIENRDPDPLYALQRRYRGAVRDIPACLQAYLRKHPAALERWRAGRYRRPARVLRPRWETVARSSHGDQKVARRGMWVGTPRRSRRERERISQRVDRFLADLESLSARQWTVVGRRYRQLRRRDVNWANEVDSDITMALWKKEAVPVGRSRHAWLTAREVSRDRAGEIVWRLSGALRARRRPAPPSAVAAMFASNAMDNYPELMQTADGRRALGILLSPFEGLITPPIGGEESGTSITT